MLSNSKKLFSTITKSIKSPINITSNAWDKMRKIIKSEECNESNGYKSFLFSANSGGCNGFNYDLKLIKEKEYNEIMNSNKIKPTIIQCIAFDSTKLIIDPVAEMLLLGTTIDYVSEDFSKGIFENKFTFTPDKKLATSCGCGVSFNPR